MILRIIAGVMVGLGAYLVLADVFKLPYTATIRAFVGLERQTYTEDGRINTALEGIAVKLAKILPLGEYKKADMEADLRAARLFISPEMYVANAIVRSGVYAVVAIPFFWLFPIVAYALCIWAVVRYFAEMADLPGRIKEKRQAIDAELPRFVSTIGKYIRHNQDVQGMIEDYATIAGSALKSELEITIADMASGNHANAVARLEARVGLPAMTEVCRGLEAILRGDDTTVYWQSMELKLSEHQRELLRAKAERVPQKVNRQSMFITFAFTGLWLIVMFTEAIFSVMQMFAS